MDLSAIFSDDQLAIIGCFVALAACGLIAAVSFHFGPAGKSAQSTQQGRSLQFPASVQGESAASGRKAA